MEESTEFSKPFDAAWTEIQRLNLEPYVSELDSHRSKPSTAWFGREMPVDFQG